MGNPAAKNSLIFSFLEKTNLSIILGDFEEFVQNMKLPEGYVNA
jgi:hypothetical protein